MVSDYTRANFSQLQQSQADFGLSLRALEDTLSDLEKDLQSHLAQWDGDARSAYYVAKQQWESAAAHMAVVLGQLGVVIGEAHQSYSAAERANSGIWGH